MNLEPVANVYTVEAEQEYERIPRRAAQQTTGYGSVPIGVAKLPEKLSMRDMQLELLEDDDEKQKQVVIPRYGGPKNTRVDFWKYENNRIVVTGIPNHPQPSCVYLRGSDQFVIDEYLDESAKYMAFLPKMFYLQRQWSKLQFEAQNMNSAIEVPLKEYIKLAPYICDRNKLNQYCKPRFGVIVDVQYDQRIMNVQSFEPLLSFQSGWAILDAIRPFNQQNMFFPLAIQDYSIQMTPFSDAKQPGRYLNSLRSHDYRDDIQDLHSFQATTGKVTLFQHEHINHRQVFDRFERCIFEEKIEHDLPTDIELVAFSQNDVIQSNKDVSDVMLHAPEFLVYSKKFGLLLEDDADATFSGLEDINIQINSALGLPSLIMLYVEFSDFASPYNSDHMFIHGPQPRIDSLRIKLFDQDVPIVKNLCTDELRYITQKNSHPNYLKENGEPIVLLDLESLGLGKDLPGYPSRDRVNAEITLLEVTLPGIPRKQYATEAQDGVQYGTDIEMNVEFKCVFIYENRVVEGNVNQMKINRKY